MRSHSFPRSRPGARLLLVPALLVLLAGCETLQGILPAEQDQAPDQRALLVGSLWVAHEIAGQPVAAEPRVTLALYPDRRLVGKAGCNTYTGRYTLDGSALRIAALDVGANSCAAEIAAQEQSFLGALGAAASYEVQADNQQPGGLLVLTTADARTLIFQRDPNATVQRLDYDCEDGTALAVIFNWAAGSASVSENGELAIALAKTPAASGFRFEAAPKSLAGEGTQAQWSTAGATPVACQVAG